MIWLVVRATAAKAANGVSRSAAAVASGPRPRPRVLAEAIEAAESTGSSIRIELERVSYEVGRSLGEEVV